MMVRGVRWLLIIVAVACTRVEESGREESPVVITLHPPCPPTRSSNPDESLITDYNILVYNSFGLLEHKTYVPRRAFDGGPVSVEARLVAEAPYTVLTAANLGYGLGGFGTLEEALSCRYYMAYPDEFSAGIPMAACLYDAVAGKNLRIDVPLERLMSRVDLCIDRRGLGTGVSLRVESVEVCNSASSVLLFAGSIVDSWPQLFTRGYMKSGSEVWPLNHDTLEGVSGVVSLYLLESCSGGLTQPYIEVKASYHSEKYHTKPGEYLVFRFHISPDGGAERNSLYHITLKPLASGLECPDGWRLDKSAIYED